MESKSGRCEGCEHARTLHATQGWSFIGCFCKPHKGKWVAEVKDCPKELTNISCPKCNGKDIKKLPDGLYKCRDCLLVFDNE